VMNAFAERFLDSLDAVDGFILKSRSPSCAIRDHEGGPGLFAARVLDRFPGVPIEDEVRLGDERLRRSFLQRTFIRAASRSR